MLIRHGTRLPSRKDMEASVGLIDLKFEILLQHEYGQGMLRLTHLSSLNEILFTITLRIKQVLLTEKMC